MLDGRSVNKDLVNKERQLHNAWVKLDFKETTANGNYKMKQFSPQYGFELEKAVAKLPIKELATDGERIKLFESLERGNRQMVTFDTAQGEQKRFIEANPQFKSITVYDETSAGSGSPSSKAKRNKPQKQSRTRRAKSSSRLLVTPMTVSGKVEKKA